MKCELIIFHRPNAGLIYGPVDTGTATTGWSYRSSVGYSPLLNPNTVMTGDAFINLAIQNQRIDLFDDISIPITYNIADISEPDKRKTSWSKTISIPGTKNNNRIFQHIYQISGDGWVKIGNQQIYTNFNPNIRKEIVVLSEGTQVLKGSLQLKTITKNSIGDIIYEVGLSGDLTSLFFDVGNSKLNDLDFSEWDHTWSQDNIINSWDGNLTKNGRGYQNITKGANKTIASLYLDATTGRLGIRTTTSHGFVAGDFIRVDIPYDTYTFFAVACGVWQVATRVSSTDFTLNTPYPIALRASSPTQLATISAYVYKVSCDGTGYTYPLASWGDEYDYNSFPVTAMAPSYFVKEIWDKIFDKTSSKYSSTFLDSEFFKRLIVTQKKTTYELTPSQILERSFYVGTELEYTTLASQYNNQYAWLNMATHSYGSEAFIQSATGIGLGTIAPQTFPFYIDGGAASTTQSFVDGVGATGIGPGGNWNTSTYHWVISKSSEYILDCRLAMDSWCDIDGDPNTYPIVHGTASLPLPKNGFDPAITYYMGGGQSATVQIMMMRRKGGVTTPTVIGSTVFDCINYVPFEHTDTNPIISTNTNTWPYFGRFQPVQWKNRPVNGSYNGYFAEGEEVWIELKYQLNTNLAPYQNPGNCGALFYNERYQPDEYGNGGDSDTYLDTKWYLRVKGLPTRDGRLSVLYNTPSPKSGENSIIYGREFLPKDMTCKDFLKNIIKAFNLHIDPDKTVEKLYYIEPRDDFYYTGASGSSDYTDWSGKLDNDSVSIVPTGSVMSKNYVFSNKAENDYWNKRFKDERGRDYMLYNKEVENDFVKSQQKIDVSFGSTVMINNPENSEVVMPAVLDREVNGSFKPSSNSLPRMLIWMGHRPYSDLKGISIVKNNNPALPNTTGWELVSSLTVIGSSNIGTSASTHKTYPYAGTVDSPQDPFYDINWFNMEPDDFVYWSAARWSDHNLYNTYWSNFINETTDPSSMLVTGYFNLSPSDIYNLDFRKVYVVDGIYYKLQKVVDYDPTSNQLTKVELLKLKSQSKYLRRSIFSTEIFSSETLVSHAIPTLIVSSPPKSKKWRDSSYTNNIPRSNSSSTININGLANYVGDASNVSINGIENHVGDSSQNITIHGNGVVVSAGSKNVNIIGTNKIFVNESDVSYVNGVRYKNGVAISRCNVIDGGIVLGNSQSVAGSLVTKQNKNVTINVINCGEDIVIDAGSSTYEDVINGGSDYILPNIPDLGLSTRTTPNPRTNYSQGANFVSPTMSLVDIVRIAKQSR